MNLFTRSATACETCGVLFKPLGRGHAHYRWRHLCLEHRDPVVDEALRHERVLLWAEVNWRRLETEMLAEEMANRAAYESARSAACGSAQNNIGGLYNTMTQAFNPCNQAGYGGY